jgi:hypothetical protein
MASPPRHGQGVHNYLFRLARVLHPYRSEQEIITLLHVLTAQCERPVPEREILDAVRNAKRTAWNPALARSSRVPQARWPAVNQEQREAIVGVGGGLVDIWEASPVRFEDNDPHTEEIIDQLFPGNPLLCVGQSNADFATKPREDWRGQLSRMQLIVPSPMTARTGLTQEGKESEHCLANTGPRRFLVIEQDDGEADEQSAILLYLAERAPLALAVHSGGKSIHGWFVAAGQPEDRLHRFMRYAVSLGADRATWPRSQFVRMPGGTRDNGNPQPAYFLNPKVCR